jgi:hypothetical protein
MRRIDREAMARAIAELRAESDQERERIDGMLAREPWERVGAFAAYCRQDTNLKLKPWMTPPCWVRDIDGTPADGDDGVMGRYAAAVLLQRMLAAGLSRYEPDPVGAFERAEARPA